MRQLAYTKILSIQCIHILVSYILVSGYLLTCLKETYCHDVWLLNRRSLTRKVIKTKVIDSPKVKVVLKNFPRLVARILSVI